VRCILAIDQGTTGSRAVLYDRDGRAVASSYREFGQYFPKPGWVEHDPYEIWESVNLSVQEVMRERPRVRVEAIGITNQRETTIVWDKLTGKPIYNAIVWQCRRTADRCVHLKRNKKISKKLRHATGLTIDPYFSATKIEWILNNVPGAREKARMNRLLFGTTDTWILWKLSGGKVHATDYTNASRTMLFNIGDLRWDKSILKEFGVPFKMLPEVRRSSGIFGETVRCGRLSQGIPIAGIAGDQQAALFGQTCFEPGTVKDTYGTGCFILLNAGKKRPVAERGLITTLGCGASGEPVYVLEGSVFIAGAAIQWLRDGLGLIKSAAESEKMACSLKDNSGVYFVPALVGLGAPYWDPEARGTITGITRGTTAGHLVRAALEAMCYQTKDVLDIMRETSGLRINELKIDGGAAANDFLCQFQSDILGVKVVRPKVIETTSLGAAYLAGLAVGFWKKSGDIRKCWKKDKTFVPAMDKKEAFGFYRGWTKAVEKTLFRGA